jgi:DNA topoisomerase-1
MRKLTLTDKGLLRVVRRVQDLPGQNLFQYLGNDGTPCPVGSADVNAYIKEATGEEFTAKHFRTWSASAIALEHVALACKAGRKAKLTDVLLPVAEALGNTPAIARKSYVHPRVLALCDAGLDTARLPRTTRWLSPTERALIALLDETGPALSKAA